MDIVEGTGDNSGGGVSDGSEAVMVEKGLGSVNFVYSHPW